MRLLLVRHGESVCGVNGIVGGPRGCTGLTERGFAQARALRERLVAEELGLDVVLASTLPRALQTAEVVAEVFGLDVVPDEGLCEFVPGEIDGTPWSEFEGFDVRAEPDRPLSPGGESLTDFRTRVGQVLERLAETYGGKTVLAACHGGILFMSRFLLANADGDADSIEFTAISEWQRGEARWSLVRHNDFAHLEGTDLLPART